MANTTQIFDMATLAEAAYASFANESGALTISNQDDLVARLQDFDANVSNGKSGFSKTQAEEFAQHYRVVSQRPNTASGYSGTVFERLDDAGNPTGQYVFSQRGTEPKVQVLTSGSLIGLGIDIEVDIGDLSADGLAWTQIVDMYNYWRELTTPAGQTYQKASLVELPVNAVVAEGNYIRDISTESSPVRRWQIQLTDASSPTGAKVPAAAALEVTGHSLGGHLASAFTRLFDGVASQTYTINGAGYSSQTYLNAIGAPANVYAQAVTFDDGAGNETTQEFATKTIANRACYIRAIGLFDKEERAANHANWRIAA